MRTITKAALLGATMFSVGGIASAQDASKSLAENAIAAGNFTTLVAAAEATGLVDELTNGGPYTLFAPTDEAFSVIDQGMLNELMLPENSAQLANLLQAHIIPGLYTSDDLQRAITANENPNASDVVLKVEDGVISADSLSAGSQIFVTKRGDAFYVSADSATMDNARISQPDIMSSNGVIHVIDHVLMPNS